VKTPIFQVVGITIVLALAGCGSGSSNNPPVANAGQDQASGVLIGDVVVLDGTASSDPDGDALTYVWSLTTMPPDSAATLSDPFADKPTFAADKAGTYVAQLTVNDGKADSAADDVSVTVVVPAPTVAIATPENQSVTNETPVTVTGTVDDPSAVVTVNGSPTSNNNGAYSANVALAEGENTVTVVATNGTGQGNASIDVTLRTARGPGPAMTITAPRPGFTAGAVWDGIGAPPSDSIPIEVIGIITPNGTPSVMVNGVPATIGAPAPNPFLKLFCLVFPNAPACDQRFTFSADVLLSKGQATVTAVGDDNSGSTTVSVNGIADYCLKGAAESGVAALRGDGQNNRCHEIDGCSNGSDPAPDSPRNWPMGPKSQYAQVTVEFGWGTIPPSEFFVHGQSPQRPLGCNIHDTCYQTCVPPGGGDRIVAWHNCNAQQLGNHKATCRKAYPATCPFTKTGPLGNTIPDPTKCIPWAAEKAKCWSLANGYFVGVEGGGEFAYNTRQNDFCSQTPNAVLK
jgi:hypothetical protein